MIPVGQMSDEEFERHALGILRRELGVDGLARFLRVYRSGSGDYTRDRHQWLEGTTIEETWPRCDGGDPPPLGNRTPGAIGVPCHPRLGKPG